MAAIGLLALLVWVRPLFAPSPSPRKPEQISPQYHLDAQFGDGIALLGYSLQADNLGPGRYVDVTFYWRAHQPMSTDYTLALQLAALAPGDTRTLLNFNTWPGGGNLPTAAWQFGQTIIDHYRVPLPQNTATTQAWRLQTLWYDAQSGNRLPLTLNGQPAGPVLTLGVVRVAGTSKALASLPDSARLSTPVTFDQSVALTHAQVDSQGNTVRVRLLWQSLASLPKDVTVFVHADDVSGKLVATGDGPPMNGNFPTSLWQKGDLALDEHTLVLPAGVTLKDVQIKAGLYQLQDGIRLPAFLEPGTSRLPEDAAVIWPR